MAFRVLIQRSFRQHVAQSNRFLSTKNIKAKRSNLKASDPASVSEDYSRFNPWSKHFDGSWKARALLQSAAYAVGIVLVTEVVDKYIFPKSTDNHLRYASRKETKLAIEDLRAEFPDPNDVTTDPDALKTYGFSENSYHPASPHTVIVSHFYILWLLPSV
ncbi:hypothetical protein H0H93_011271 [Arthromyces matolae]|nr:hypothetical protein H0H93_011271 [Arthromyces matolae]